MSPSDSLLVDCRLVPIEPGAYPHSEGQVWAEPNIEVAAKQAARLIDDPVGTARVAASGSRHVRLYYSNRAVGLRIRDRLRHLAPGLLDGLDATHGRIVP
jgi:hypothetical protein